MKMITLHVETFWLNSLIIYIFLTSLALEVFPIFPFVRHYAYPINNWIHSVPFNCNERWLLFLERPVKNLRTNFSCHLKKKFSGQTILSSCDFTSNLCPWVSFPPHVHVGLRVSIAWLVFGFFFLKKNPIFTCYEFVVNNSLNVPFFWEGLR